MQVVQNRVNPITSKQSRTDAVFDIKAEAGQNASVLAGMVFDLREALAEQIKQIDDANDKVIAARQEIADAKNTVKLYESEIEDLHANITAWQNQVAELTGLLSALKDKYTQQVEITAQAAMQVANARGDLVTLQHKNLEIIESTKHEIYQLEDSINRAKAQNKQFRSLRTDYQLLLEENVNLTQKLNSKLIWKKLKFWSASPLAYEDQQE